MELNMQRARPLYRDEMAHCDNPQIRQFVVPQTYNFNQQQTDYQGGSWVSVNSTTISKFSAVAYFFAREINFRYQVPVGIINASLGGSPAEAWISEEALKSFPAYYKTMQWFKSKERIDSIERADQNRSQRWYNELAKNDLGWKIRNTLERW
jgi:sialate O-acetylesterase